MTFTARRLGNNNSKNLTGSVNHYGRNKINNGGAGGAKTKFGNRKRIGERSGGWVRLKYGTRRVVSVLHLSIPTIFNDYEMLRNAISNIGYIKSIFQTRKKRTIWYTARRNRKLRGPPFDWAYLHKAPTKGTNETKPAHQQIDQNQSQETNTDTKRQATI